MQFCVSLEGQIACLGGYASLSHSEILHTTCPDAIQHHSYKEKHFFLHKNDLSCKIPTSWPSPIPIYKPRIKLNFLHFSIFGTIPHFSLLCFQDGCCLVPSIVLSKENVHIKLYSGGKHFTNQLASMSCCRFEA